MSFRKAALVSGSALILSGIAMIGAQAAAPMSDADKTFVAKVSQGGMSEVELGKVVEKQGAAQDIRNQGNTEAHDHMLVGDKLKTIATGAGLAFPSTLNEEFQARLDKISALKGEAFDTAYVEDMKKIHAADGAAFAAETHRIVERHIGELDAKVH